MLKHFLEPPRQGFDAQDVLVPALPQDVATLAGQRLSGLTKALALFFLFLESYIRTEAFQ
jgi:hypothetical protein